MTDTRRLDYLDGLRGFAALMVVVQHAAQVAIQKGSGLFVPLLDTINLGRFGVVLFFLISGFVIPFSFRGANPVRDFAVSRAFRLYPAYWLSVLVLSAVLLAKGTAVSPELFLANLTMVQGSFGVTNIGFGYWTLNLEVIFYVSCAVLFSTRRIEDAGLVGALALSGMALSLAPYGLAGLTGSAGFVSEVPYFLGMFMVGLLLRRAFVERCGDAARWCRVVVPAAMIAGTALGGWYFPVGLNRQQFFGALPLGLAMSLPLALFVAVLKWQPRPTRAMLFLGAVSYSLYLFQDAGLHGVAAIIDAGAHPVAYVVAVTGVTLAMATLIYRTVEMPMIAAGRTLIGRKAKPSAFLAPS